MQVELIPTEKGKVVLKTFMLYPYPFINEDAWNNAIDEAIHFLEEHKIRDGISKQFKRGDKI